MEDVKELCKRVIIIDHGKILYDGELNIIIKHYAPYKFISLVFQQPVPKQELETMGLIQEYQSIRATLTVPLEKSIAVATQLLQKFPVEDITIQEPKIETIISRIFNTPMQK